MDISSVASSSLLLQQASTNEKMSIAMMKSAANAQNQVAGLLEKAAAQEKTVPQQQSGFSVIA